MAFFLILEASFALQWVGVVSRKAGTYYDFWWVQKTVDYLSK